MPIIPHATLDGAEGWTRELVDADSGRYKHLKLNLCMCAALHSVACRHGQTSIWRPSKISCLTGFIARCLCRSPHNGKLAPHARRREEHLAKLVSVQDFSAGLPAMACVCWKQDAFLPPSPSWGDPQRRLAMKPARHDAESGEAEGEQGRSCKCTQDCWLCGPQTFFSLF